MSRPPIAVGEIVTLRIDGTEQSATVLDVSPWAYILARGEDGHLYLDVVISQSAVSWSRLVRLRGTAERSRTAATANVIAADPTRKTVSDIPDAEAMLPATDRLILR